MRERLPLMPTGARLSQGVPAIAPIPVPGARISVIVPVLNEATRIEQTLADVRDDAGELIVVDGGSSDGTAEISASAGATVVGGVRRGRASQMNAGAQAASGDILLFLHADTRLPTGWAEAVRTALAGPRPAWGRFDVRLDDPSPLLALVGAMMNLRSRVTGICTGDQAIFVSREAWRVTGGFPAIDLMEDIALSRRLKRLAGRPASLRERALVSARRWRSHGALRTIVGMWWWRALYFLGASPAWLHRRYYGRDA